MSTPKLLNKQERSPILTIQISESDLYHILYRLKHQDKLHNVYPDLSSEPRDALAKLLGRDLGYIEDLY